MEFEKISSVFVMCADAFGGELCRDSNEKIRLKICRKQNIEESFICEIISMFMKSASSSVT